MVLKRYFENLEPALEKVNDTKNQVVFDTIKDRWPASVSKANIILFRAGIAVLIVITLLEFKSNALLTLLFTVGMLAGYVNEVFIDDSDEKSAFSLIVDSVIDRAIVIPVAFYLLAISNTPLLAAMVLMEICNAFITLSTEGAEPIHQTNIFGKSKTLFQIIGCAGLLLFWRFTPLNILFVATFWSSLVFFMLSMRQKIYSISTHHARQESANQNLQYAFKEEGNI